MGNDSREDPCGRLVRLEAENRYYADFICWKNLYREFVEFKRNAREERDCFGLPYYTCNGSMRQKDTE